MSRVKKSVFTILENKPKKVVTKKHEEAYVCEREGESERERESLRERV
jgi:hypothetical protein